MAFEGYFFDEQIAKYQIQFMAIFKNLHVATGIREDGNVRFLEVPVIYGSADRVTASVLAQNTQNTALKLPIMSAYMKGLSMGTDRFKGSGTSKRFSYLPKGGMFPNDIKTVVQPMAVPYDMTMELSIHTTNMYQHRQILEQILVFFDPLLQIQKTDDAFDPTKITMVELTDISFDEQYPAGERVRTIVTTLTFDVPIWLSVPANLKKEFIEKVFMRLHALDYSEDISEFAASLESIDTPYTEIINATENFTPVQVGEDCDQNDT